MKRTQPTHRKPVRRKAFTLIEVLLVLVILGVLAALVVPNLMGTQQSANIKQTKTSIYSVESTLRRYMVEKNKTVWPKSLESLMATTDEDGEQQVPVWEEFPKDAWGNKLNYEPPQDGAPLGTKAKIWSNGPNGNNEQGGGDDISNEVKQEDKQ